MIKLKYSNEKFVSADVLEREHEIQERSHKTSYFITARKRFQPIVWFKLNENFPHWIGLSKVQRTLPIRLAQTNIVRQQSVLAFEKL